ncbi:MAG TPA: cytochrome-c oxidase, cbb3-type subunit II [Gammaproteobacteria bacterium]|nr:cytochrome-c oxidase, cbb3-type subunit II [Gammaproteobacteria bacterium]
MKHESLEINAGLLALFVLVVISIGGLVEIVPLFYLPGTVEKVAGVHPYTPLELRGRDIYQREGCFYCHSQMVRPFRNELLRYGHYSLAAESEYDHPFLWGSKRTGPDLARVGGKYSNEWLTIHLIDPRSVVPQSIMPDFPWLATTDLEYSDIQERMEALKEAGVPYTDTEKGYQANVKRFGPKLAEQLNIPDAEKNLIAQAEQGDYDGNPKRLTEMDAVVAYLQVLGTMVDFSKYNEGYFAKFR